MTAVILRHTCVLQRDRKVAHTLVIAREIAVRDGKELIPARRRQERRGRFEQRVGIAQQQVGVLDVACSKTKTNAVV